MRFDAETQIVKMTPARVHTWKLIARPKLGMISAQDDSIDFEQLRTLEIGEPAGDPSEERPAECGHRPRPGSGPDTTGRADIHGVIVALPRPDNVSLDTHLRGEEAP